DLLNLVRRGEDDDGKGAGGKRGNTGNSEGQTREQGEGTRTQRKNGVETRHPANTWIGTVERALIQNANDSTRWLKLFTDACERAHSPDDINALEDLDGVRITLENAPPEIRTQMRTALAGGRKRLSGQGEFSASLVDAFGYPSKEPFTTT